jgi:AcrR family transcriptional regulator
MFSTPQRRISKKKEQIVETASALFMKFGFRRITVEEICRKTGVSKMTFYKYFPNKMALLKNIWNGMVDAGYKKLFEIDAKDMPFPEKMQRMIEYKIELGSQMNREFLDEMLGAVPEMKDFWDEIQAKSYRLFMDFVTRAQERGDIREMRPEFFLAVLNKLHELILDQNLRNIYPDYSEFIREVNSFFFFGILPAKNQENH